MALALLDMTVALQTESAAQRVGEMTWAGPGGRPSESIRAAGYLAPAIAVSGCLFLGTLRYPITSFAAISLITISRGCRSRSR